MDSAELRKHVVVLPRDALCAAASPEGIAKLANETVGCTGFTLAGNSAVACLLSPDLLPLRVGPAVARDARSRFDDAFKQASECLLPDSGITVLQVPSSRYWIRLALPAEEADEPTSRMRVSRQTGGDSVLRIFSPQRVGADFGERLRVLLAEWMKDRAGHPHGDERFGATLADLRLYSRAGTADRSAEVGIEARFSDLPAVTWPWVDLFLWYRKSLLLRERVNFLFEIAAGSSV